MNHYSFLQEVAFIDADKAKLLNSGLKKIGKRIRVSGKLAKRALKKDPDVAPLLRTSKLLSGQVKNLVVNKTHSAGKGANDAVKKITATIKEPFKKRARIKFIHAYRNRPNAKLYSDYYFNRMIKQDNQRREINDRLKSGLEKLGSHVRIMELQK